MVTLGAILLVNPRLGLFVPLVAAFLIIPAFIGLFSLRQTVCYYLTVISGLVLADVITLVLANQGGSGGRGSPEAGWVVVFLGLAGLPLGFLAGLVLSNIFLPKNLLKNVKRKYRVCAFVLSLLLLGGSLFMRKEVVKSPESLLELARGGPEALNNKSVRNIALALESETLIIEDRVFRGLEFIDCRFGEDRILRELEFADSRIGGVVFRNVTFDNCLFDNSRFLNVALDNVTFKNCTFKKGEYNDTYFEAEVLNATFDGGHLDGLRVNAENGGAVTLRNIRLAESGRQRPSPIHGSKIHLRVDNCVFEGRARAGDIDGAGEATLYVTDSRFVGDNSGFFIFGGDMKAIWIADSRFEGVDIPTARTLVIKNSYLGNGIGYAGGDAKERHAVYLENCEYPLRTRYDDKFGTGFQIGDDDADLFLYGKAPRQKNVHFSQRGGRMHVFDAEIACLDLMGGAYPAELYLKNVVVKGGSWKAQDPAINLDRTLIVKGAWEDVEIYPKVYVKDADIRALTVHNLRFPDGSPWMDAGEATFAAMTESGVPLNIPRPSIPTLDELGIVDSAANRR